MFKDELLGRQFDFLRVDKYLGHDKHGKPLWECTCTCGMPDCLQIVQAVSQRLKYTTKRKKKCRGRIKHGMSKHPLYIKWGGMYQRCYNKDLEEYKDYGGRGIRVCDEWLDKETGFQTFYDWAISTGWRKGLTIERNDPDGNYCPKNCSWIPPGSQARNKRNTIRIMFNGTMYPLVELAEIFDIKISTLYNQYHRGGEGAVVSYLNNILNRKDQIVRITIDVRKEDMLSVKKYLLDNSLIILRPNREETLPEISLPVDRKIYKNSIKFQHNGKTYYTSKIAKEYGLSAASLGTTFYLRGKKGVLIYLRNKNITLT